METHERSYVVDNLDKSEARLLQLTDGLSAAQWHFKPASGRWSIAEIVEHCILVDQAIAGGIRNALTSPPDESRQAAVAGKEVYVKAVGDREGRKLEAQEAFQPTGRWPETAAMLKEMRAVRAVNTAFARETDANLRAHFFPHQALGELDCYQWLVIMSLHGERHAKQMEEVKASQGYPA